MDKYHKKTDNTDGEETMFFRAAGAGKTTDQYDTQQLNAGQIRRQAQQNVPPRNGYPQSDFLQNPNGYSRSDIPQGNYPQEGYPPRQTGAPQGYPPRQAGASQGYSPRQTGAPTNRPMSGNRPPQGNYRAPQRQAARPPQQRQQTARPPQRQSAPQQRQAPPPRQAQQARAPRQNTRTAPPQKSARSRRRKGSPFSRLVKLLCTIVVVIFLIYSAVAMAGIMQMDRVETGDRSVTSGSLGTSYVKNVLVIGTDTRDLSEERGRSDSMILVSMNSKTNEIYMTSFMRDSYVSIPGNGSAKLNAAYSYGGPELLMDTIEQNFDVRIDDYVTITFEACAGMIDAVGGVELTISDEEAQAVNEILISEVNGIMGDEREDDLLDGGGTLKLDGKQALSYSRIRYVGNADFERTERQRTVMTQVMEKAKKNPLRLASICMSALPKMTTNLSAGSLYLYAITTPLKLVTYDVQQQRVPADGTYSGATIDGQSVLQVDFDAAKQQLSSTVFTK